MTARLQPSRMMGGENGQEVDYNAFYALHIYSRSKRFTHFYF